MFIVAGKLRTNAASSPSISGPNSMSLPLGYSSTTSQALVISGDPAPNVRITSGNSNVSWNASGSCFNIQSGLSTGIYQIILAASNSNGSTNFTFTLNVGNLADFYNVTITAGYGGTIKDTSGYYKAGDTVNVYAYPDQWSQFDIWTSGSRNVLFSDAQNRFTTFTMPKNNVEIRANFVDQNGDPYYYNDNYYSLGNNDMIYYTITFYPNNGGASFQQSVSFNGKLKQPADPYYSGFVFAGWYIDRELTQPYDFNAYVKSNLSLFAKWNTAVTPTVTPAYYPTATPAPAPVNWNSPFSDVGMSDWFAPAVNYVYQKGLMLGTAQNLFSPNVLVSRGMLVTTLYRNYGGAGDYGMPFSDVQSGAYYAGAIGWAGANGIVFGYGNNKFGPDDSVTREDLAVIIDRYMNYKGIVLGVTRDKNTFTDDSQISGYARDAVNRLYMYGVIAGKPGNLFDPKGFATRAEVAQMLMQLLGV